MMQFDAETLVAMRSVLDDTCRDIPVNRNQVRSYVATAILDCVKSGEPSIDAMKYAASIALLEVYANTDLVRGSPAELDWAI